MAQVLCPRTRQRIYGTRYKRRFWFSVLDVLVVDVDVDVGLSFIPRPNPQSQRNTRTPRSCEVCRSGKLCKRKLLGRKIPWQDTYLMGTRSMHLGGYFIFTSRDVLAGRHEMTSLSSCWTASRWGWNLAQRIWINTPLFQRPSSASIPLLNSSLIFFFFFFKFYFSFFYSN